jgi:hypothetical protein
MLGGFSSGTSAPELSTYPPDGILKGGAYGSQEEGEEKKEKIS